MPKIQLVMYSGSSNPMRMQSSRRADQQWIEGGSCDSYLIEKPEFLVIKLN
jgi:hypothetical protein